MVPTYFHTFLIAIGLQENGASYCVSECHLYVPPLAFSQYTPPLNITHPPEYSNARAHEWEINHNRTKKLISYSSIP